MKFYNVTATTKQAVFYNGELIGYVIPDAEYNKLTAKQLHQAINNDYRRAIRMAGGGFCLMDLESNDYEIRDLHDGSSCTAKQLPLPADHPCCAGHPHAA
jgi:hypothetical protein